MSVTTATRAFRSAIKHWGWAEYGLLLVLWAFTVIVPYVHGWGFFSFFVLPLVLAATFLLAFAIASAQSVDRAARAVERSVSSLPLHHPVLGDLVPDKARAGTYGGEVSHGAGSVALTVAPDDQSIESALALAVAAVDSLEHLDAKARKLLAEHFLEAFNTNWRFGEVALPSGKTEPFNKPALSAEEFCRTLRFEALEVSGAMVTFWYADGEMFAGHTLSVASFDGITMEDVHVSMFG